MPTPEEAAHDFLWRVHSAVPGKGEIGIFNRSHYESVLVVRVHNLEPETVWRRHYGEIRDWEKMLTDSGVTILKFFLHVSHAEQKRRFLERLDTPEKNWKFSAADIAERQHWREYMAAYQDMIRATATPWRCPPARRR